MKGLVIEGVYKNGVIELQEDVPFKEGTKVLVLPIETQVSPEKDEERIRQFLQNLKPGKASDAVPDHLIGIGEAEPDLSSNKHKYLGDIKCK